MSGETHLIRTVRQAKIVGGVFAERGEFPHQVSLSYHDEFICGGSIISTLLILTAAHCVKYKRANRLTVTAGEHDRSNNSNYFDSHGYGSEQVRSAKYIYMHEGYVWETDVNDIALIVLTEPLQYSAHVQNISLPGTREEFSDYALVSGWGRTKEKGPTSSILRKVRVPIVPNDECRRLYRKVKMTVTEKMLCAGDFNMDSCQGDSGGPAICRGEKGPWVICGVISHGQGCGRQGFPGIYTAVSNYIDWIEITGKKIIARGKCRTNEFYCSSGPGCIPRTFLCDLDTDCKDNQDEKDCTYMTNCNLNQFRCNNGRCIRKQYTCDDMDDCGDRSDEDKCPNENKSCLVGHQHQCGIGGRCIPNEWKCDSMLDCDDKSDERDCDRNADADNEIEPSVKDPSSTNASFSSTVAPCPEDKFYCWKDYRCIPLKWRCDGDRDCRSGIDEIGCSSDNDIIVSGTSTASSTDRTTSSTPTSPISSTTTTSSSWLGSNDNEISVNNSSSSCPRDQFRCGNGRCIPIVFKCDFDLDCLDGSDERDCPSTFTTIEPTCGPHFWRCANGQCIIRVFRCDNDEGDCADLSDERGCEDHDIDVSSSTTSSTDRTTSSTPASPISSTSSPTTTTSSSWLGNDNEISSIESETRPPSPESVNNSSLSCSRAQFRCDNGKCISNVFMCDFDNDCGDNSDEKNCPSLQPTCGPFFWRCTNGQCIYHKFRCDNDEGDCADKSDEQGCENDDIVSNRLRRRLRMGSRRQS